MKRLVGLEMGQRSFGESRAERTYTWQMHPRGRLRSWPMKTHGFSVGTGGSRCWVMVKVHQCMVDKQPLAGRLL